MAIAAWPAAAGADVTVTASGPLTTGYLGAGQQSTTVSASGGPISELAYKVDTAAWTYYRVPCTRQNPFEYCPSQASAVFGPYSTAASSEGKHTLTVAATPSTGRGPSTTSVTNTFDFFVDRTAPGIVPWFDTAFDSDTSRTLVTWIPIPDPALPDGSPGSGTATYTYRYQLNGGAWSAWVTTPANHFILAGTHSTDVVSLEVQPTDRVGNVGTVSTATLGVADGTFDRDYDDDTVDGDSGTSLAAGAFAASDEAYRVRTVYNCSSGSSFYLREGYDNDGRGFGYQHIKARRGAFTDAMDNDIKDTLCGSDFIKNEGGGSYTYFKFFDSETAGTHGWRVTYQRKSVRYDGHSKGIITAVPIDQKTPFVPWIP
jgi:hypothetical protein